MMEGAFYFKSVLCLTLGKLCRQRWLLAGLALLCFTLPPLAGRTAYHLLSRGVDFSPVTLAVTAPEGDGTPRLLERYLGEMEDIAQYCHIVSMDREEAQAALERGEADAVLALPEAFVQGVMEGENPPLELIVPADRPLESLLLLWVGQSACDLLTAVQSGIYAVLGIYDQAPPEGLARSQVVRDMNLRCIRLSLGRSGMFREQPLSAAGALPISLHYTLALLSCFALSAAPLPAPLYRGGWLAFQRRLRCAGRGSGTACLAALLAGTLALFLLLAPALLAAGEGGAAGLLAAALGMAVFCSLFAALCALATGSDAGCGGLSFLTALLSLFLAGGVLPPVLLPEGIRRLGALSPVRWLMSLAAWPMGYPPAPADLAGLLLGTAVLVPLVLFLYRRRVEGEEAAP